MSLSHASISLPRNVLNARIARIPKYTQCGHRSTAAGDPVLVTTLERALKNKTEGEERALRVVKVTAPSTKTTRAFHEMPAVRIALLGVVAEAILVVEAILVLP
jgi:hypothetical protein